MKKIYQNIKDIKAFRKWLRILAIIFFVFAALITVSAVASYAFYYSKYDSKIFPNISIGNIYLGGKEIDEAEKILNKRTEELNKGISFFYNSKNATIYPSTNSLEADSSFELIFIDPKKLLEKAYDHGRSGDLKNDIIDRLNLLFIKKTIPADFDIVDERISAILKEKFPLTETAPKNAQFKIAAGKIEITEEKPGIEINYDQALKNLETRLSLLDFSPIELSGRTVEPGIKKADLENYDIKSKIENTIAIAPIVLTYDKEKWKLDKANLEKLISIKNDFTFCETSTLDSLIKIASTTNDEILKSCDTNDNNVIGLDLKLLKTYFEKSIAKKINKDPQSPRFEMKNGKVSEFNIASDGMRLNADLSLMSIEYAIARGKKTAPLAAEIVKNEITGENFNDLGIKEIVGTGKSNFAGSPKNRRINIKVGASKLHGRLIKPGEEFSLLGALGKIDGTTGFLPELVIKEGKTIPEFGGGLCQVGTTMFRATLASGLPVTMRTNHSYRVPYYEPAGTDATIYDPWPDYKFKNDTDNYILIQMRIEGNNLYFDFWGTKDGRIANQTKPVVSNLKPPPPMKTIETLDLKPGVKKCTEKAHTGADAHFNYTVTYSDGAIKKKTFNSHYKPWQAVCLVGVEKLTAPGTAANDAPAKDKPTTTNASSTTKTISPITN